MNVPVNNNEKDLPTAETKIVSVGTRNPVPCTPVLLDVQEET